MATMLEKYQNICADLTEGDCSMVPEEIWIFQEVVYRIEVLQVCQALVNNAPVGNEMKDMFSHYQMTDAYLENLKSERRNGTSSDQEMQKQQDTAHQNLCRVVEDYRKRFGSFSPTKQDHYKSEIGKVINTFLPAWICYRNKYINISSKEASQ